MKIECKMFTNDITQMRSVMVLALEKMMLVMVIRVK